MIIEVIATESAVASILTHSCATTGMDSAIKELSKLQKTNIPIVSADKEQFTSNPTARSVDDLLNQLYELKERLVKGVASLEDVTAIPNILAQKKKEIEEKQKEQYVNIARFGKVLDKVCRITMSDGSHFILLLRRFQARYRPVQTRPCSSLIPV